MKKKINKKLKIAICVNGRAHEGGVTTFINNMVDALKNLDYQVDVITIFGKSQYRQIKTNLIKKTDTILKNKPILTLIAYQISKLILAWHLFLNHLINHYDTVWAIDMSAANITYPLKYLTKIILINFPIGETSKELVDQGKIKKGSLIQKYFRKEERKALERSDLNICPSIHLSHIKNLTIKHAPLIFIKTPVDTKAFYPDTSRREEERKSLSISPQTFVILSVSRLAYRKGVRYPIMAIKEIVAKEKDKNYLLLYVGDGPEKIWLEQFRKKYCLEAYVKFIGTIPHKETIDFFQLADCFTFCSIKDRGIFESHSHAPIEAMACGTPVIAFDTFNSAEPGSERVFVDGKNCLLIPEKDTEMLVNAIKKIKYDSLVRKKIINGGISYIKKNDQTPTSVAKKIIEQILRLKK